MSKSPAEIMDGKPGPTFGSVFSEVSQHMRALDRFMLNQLEAFEPEIRPMVKYCIDTSGKRIRPALVFLSGWRAADVVPEDLVRVAAVVEMVHLATLVHDDIMDSADLRRNRETAVRAYGPTAAVLLGDALFAHALNLATEFPTTEICSAVSESTRKVCAGEIIQTLRRRSTSINRADYRKVIDLKTAELFRVSCALGAHLGGSTPKYVQAVAQFGRQLGVAYQMYDDLADYFGSESNIGKTLGTDLESGKITLPLITLLERLPETERVNALAEISGKQGSSFDLRSRQMHELGVFASVADEINRELQSAAGKLEEWSNEPSSTLLLRLCGVLRAQVASLAVA